MFDVFLDVLILPIVISDGEALGPNVGYAARRG
jgi:hypothetical protein